MRCRFYRLFMKNSKSRNSLHMKEQILYKLHKSSEQKLIEHSVEETCFNKKMLVLDLIDFDYISKCPFFAIFHWPPLSISLKEKNCWRFDHFTPSFILLSKTKRAQIKLYGRLQKHAKVRLHDLRITSDSLTGSRTPVSRGLIVLMTSGNHDR